MAKPEPAISTPAVSSSDAGGNRLRNMAKSKKFRVTIGIVVILLLALFLWPDGSGQVKYVTEAVTQGPLVVKISATGNLQPTTQVDVGSELSGTIVEVLVNDNDQVTKDQVLARLDTSKLSDEVVKSEAALKSAQATVQLNKAATKEANTNLERLQEAWRLSGGKVPSKNDLTVAEATLEKAQANEASAEATVAQAEATLRYNQTNMSKAVIKSPIDGMVLLRKVEPGQTVAAQMSTPVLFVLAQSLTQMELQVDIDEADVGQVREGQTAEFTVDAYSGRTYPAKIMRVRYGSETTNGVVTYQGVLQVSNDDLSLRPGMTATASIVTFKNDNATLIPNAALRYTPPAAEGEKKQSVSVISKLMPRPPREKKTLAFGSATTGSEQTVWMLRDGKPVSVTVKVGSSDGRRTEMLSGNLKPGDELITESQEAGP